VGGLLSSYRGFKFLTVILFVFLAFGSYLLSEHYVFAQTDQTASKLLSANNAVEQAFSAVLDAEKVGANVTGLVSQLNNADSILAQAENSNRTGDFSTASVQADSVLPIVQKITITAQEAKQTALVSGQNAFWSTIAFTVIGVFILVLVLFLGWGWLKRRYISSLSEAKPEVVSQ